MSRYNAYFILDCSESMTGKPIEIALKAIKIIVSKLKAHLCSIPVHLSLIAFGNKAQQLWPLSTLESFRIPDFSLNGTACLGEALGLLEKCIEKEIKIDPSQQISPWQKPIVFIFSNGYPTGSWQLEALSAKLEVNKIFAFAVGPNPDLSTMSFIADSLLTLDTVDIESRLEPLFEPITAGPTVSGVDTVQFSAFAPAGVKAETFFILDIWAHKPNQLKKVIELAKQLSRKAFVGSKGPALVDMGTILAVSVDLPEFYVKDPVDVILWIGEPSNASFSILAPTNISPGKHNGKAIITINGITILKLIFQIKVGEDTLPTNDYLPVQEERAKTAFASYASQDRKEVLSRVQGMCKANQNLDVFLDVLSLRSGQNWEKQTSLQILSRDVFYLFWSRSAAASKMVEREWRLALENRGLEYIDPVPIESPDIAPPPIELSNLHFHDYYLAYIKGGETLSVARK